MLPVEWQVLGNSLSFSMTAGVLLWPVVFIMTDIINEYFGRSGVKLFSYIAAGLVAYAFVCIFFAIHLTPADFWITKQTINGPLDMQNAFTQIFGQGLWIIIGSLVAFLVGQIVDVSIFHGIKKRTGNKYLWLRSTGSTVISQFIDSYIVLFIAFYIGAGWPLALVLGIGTVNFIYKVTVAVLLTPILYGVHSLIDAYLGKELAEAMMREAQGEGEARWEMGDGK